ncbi:MAG: hypothetical protein K2L50_05050 [Bacteroidales bacterium]|nr:hypothetical protein [Bacteroidales bacterium]
MNRIGKVEIRVWVLSVVTLLVCQPGAAQFTPGFSNTSSFFQTDLALAQASPRVGKTDFGWAVNMPASSENMFFSDKRPQKRKELFTASPGIDAKTLTFAQRNSGAFRRKKMGGMKSPGMAALCSAVVPGLGQIYNGQWYKTPVLYAGVGVLAYFTKINLDERNVYQKEIRLRTDSTATNFNPDLTDYSLQEILDLRNYYEQNFEICIIIAGVVYLLNIVDALVYAHLSSFNVSPNLALTIKPYARTNFALRNTFPLDAGIRLCLTLK